MRLHKIKDLLVCSQLWSVQKPSAHSRISAMMPSGMRRMDCATYNGFTNVYSHVTYMPPGLPITYEDTLAPADAGDALAEAMAGADKSIVRLRMILPWNTADIPADLFRALSGARVWTHNEVLYAKWS
jgi:hypothetical protein